MTLKLDENQQKAVEHFQGPALVVAGPGSGKTTVIKERILHLIREHNVDPEQILAIAFTNAAADEMTDRLSNEPLLSQGKPKTCTLHTFGKDLITDNPEQAGFKEAPHNIWNADNIGQVINAEKYRLQRTTDTAFVTIYKFEGMTTGRCYIGQTMDPKRREQEHRTYSSNRGLRAALQTNDEKFEFKVIARVIGQNADDKEAHEIRLHRNRAAVNLDQNTKKLENAKMHIPVSIYKIKSRTTATCWIGQSEKPEQSIEDHYHNSSDDDLRNAIDNGKFEIIMEKLPRDKATRHVLQEIERHKNWAVFNRQDPLQARDSNRRRIEIFCKYFDVSYDEVIEHTQKFKDLMDRFNTMKDDIEKVKRQVHKGLFEPDEIADPVLRAFARRYEARKMEAKAIDFLDMLIFSANMLEKHPKLLHEYHEKYRYVFVDEFQDISPVDFRLIKLFPENLFAVGDDDQAIYGFRGGDSQIMQEKFGKWEQVVNYEITRNYRSISSVVKHARSLIIHNNPYRFSKNLRAENLADSRVDVLRTSPDTVEKILLNELLPVVTVCETHFKENIPYLENLLLQELTVSQEIGILVRNWFEVKKIRQILRGSRLLRQGFKVDWCEADDPEKRKMFLQRGTTKIEVSTIHSAKGREWEKVIVVVNMTANPTSENSYISLPDKRNDVADERRVFYVAITRAKHELIVLDGRHCQFISEFKNVRPIEILETIEFQIKKELPKISQKALETLKLKFKQELEKELTTVLKQSDELNRLRSNAAEAEKASKQIEIDLPQQIKFTNNALLEGLIPVLDEFESQISSLLAATESYNEPDNFVEFTKSVQLAQTQLLDLLKNHGLRLIETLGEIFNPAHHEEIQPAIYSDEVQAGWVAREERRGYLLHNQVICKAQVVVSKGPEFWTPERLDRIIERYIDRLIFEFQNKYQLGNIDRALVKLRMVQYLTELDSESVGEIDSFAVMNKRPSGRPKLYANYCVGPEKTHLCTDVFRGFWNRMWQVVEQSRKNSDKDESAQLSIDKPTPMLKIEIERSEEFLTVRNIERMPKTLEPILGTNDSTLVPKAECIPLNEPISVIVPEPGEEAIDISPPISTDFTESLDTYLKDLKPEPREIVEVQSDPLYEPIDLIVPESLKKMVDSRLPTPENSSRVPNLQTQDLTPEPPPIEIYPDLLETVNSNADSTLPGYEDFIIEQIRAINPETLEPSIVSDPPIAVSSSTQEAPRCHEDILQEQVQDLRPDIAAPENPGNVTQQPTSEERVDRETPVHSTGLTRPDSSAEIDSDTRQIKVQDSSENKVENGKKSFRNYLSQGGRFVVEKIKVIIFRKPSS